MGKKFLAVALLVTITFFTSCSDDDNGGTPPVVETPNILEGTWKAEILSYDIPGVHSGTYPFTAVKQGCETDYLKFEANKTVVLTENNKVENVCTDVPQNGTWTEVSVVLGEITRTISSVSDEELVLVYPMAYGSFGTIDVTVKYSRQ